MVQTRTERRFVRLAAAANQRAARTGTRGRISSVDLAIVYQRSDGLCAYCPTEIDPLHCSFDHALALDKGGANDTTNIVACCMTCQREKFTKDPTALTRWRELSVTCPVDGVVFRPRWADWVRGYGRYCSRRCSGSVGGVA